MKRMTATGALLLLLLAPGCAGTQYGSRHYDVVIDSTPTHCKAWLVEYPEWKNHQNALMDTLATARAHLDSGVTPWKVSLLPYRYVVIVMDEKKVLGKTEFNPARQNNVNVTVGSP